MPQRINSTKDQRPERNPALPTPWPKPVGSKSRHAATHHMAQAERAATNQMAKAGGKQRALPKTPPPHHRADADGWHRA
eukprot:2097776-Amphidinium_carterae.1